VGRWDLARDRYQPGALRGRVYPQRCDLSPDGRWRRGLPFDDAQWADWDATGRLLVATTAGRLQIREDKRGAWAVTSEVALGGVTPEPVPPPAEAARW
jgi:hypothetical protein